MAVQKVNIGHVVGPGVPTGGSTGAILRKRSGANYDTEWAAFKPVLWVDCGTIETLPVTITNANIKNDMVVVGYEFGTPAAFESSLTVDTGTGYVTLSGTIIGTSTVELWLASSL